MSCDHGHLRAMRLLPFTAAIALMLKWVAPEVRRGCYAASGSGLS